jgi:hypothetical protein
MLIGTANARIVLKDEQRSSFIYYKTTPSAVKKTLDRVGIDYEEDKDGDLKLYLAQGGKEYRGLLIFTRVKGTRVIKRLVLIAGFGTKAGRYSDMMRYVNNWNKNKTHPRLYMLDEDSLRLEIQYPALYGFNPDNLARMLKLFRSAMFYIGRQIDDMRR